MSSTLSIGTAGEDIAAQFLKYVGYAIWDRNVRIERDEIDIVAYDPKDDVVAFVEVKTRSKKDEFYRPELNVDVRKRRALHRAATRWITMHNEERGFRVDLICVADGTVTDHWKQIDCAVVED